MIVFANCSALRSLGSLYLTIFALIIFLRNRPQTNTTADLEAETESIKAKTEGLFEKDNVGDVSASGQNEVPQYPFSPQELPNRTPRLGSDVLVINGVVYRAMPNGEAQAWKSREIAEMVASSPLDKAIEMGTPSVNGQSAAVEERRDETSST